MSSHDGVFSGCITCKDKSNIIATLIWAPPPLPLVLARRMFREGTNSGLTFPLTRLRAYIIWVIPISISVSSPYPPSFHLSKSVQSSQAHLHTILSGTSYIQGKSFPLGLCHTGVQHKETGFFPIIPSCCGARRLQVGSLSPKEPLWSQSDH